MKQLYLIFGAVVIILGLLLAVGPKMFFKPCDPSSMAASSDGCGSAGDCGGDSCSGGHAPGSDCCDTDSVAEDAPVVIGGSCCGDSSGGGGGCGTSINDYPVCFWTVQAVLGLAFLIIALGLCIIVFSDPRINLGLSIGIFLSGIVALFIPNSLIPGCPSLDMACKTAAFPAVTVISVILIALTVAYIVYLEIKNKVFS